MNTIHILKNYWYIDIKMIRTLIFSVFFITTCGCQNSINTSPDDPENMNPILSHVPENYSIIKEDNFDFLARKIGPKDLLTMMIIQLECYGIEILVESIY